jgi:hypothetical protein
MGPKPNGRMRNRAAATLSIFPALLAGFVLLLALPGPAAAAKPCWERVIDDWLADGRIDGTYKVSCYQAALKNVQEDLRDYSNVTDVIQAAMQDALRAKSTETPSGPTSTPGATSGNDTTPSAKTRKLQNVPPRSYYRRAIDNLGTTKADSLPIPLLVLAALGSLLLLTAAGLAGAKRYRAVRHRQKPPPSP